MHRLAEREMIRLHAAADAPLPCRRPQIVRGRLEDEIARLDAEEIIDDAERADIEINDLIVRLLMLLHELRRLAVERLAVIDARETVLLDEAMHLADLVILRQLHRLTPLVLHLREDILHAAPHDERMHRLQDEVPRAHLERLRARVAIVARDHRHDGDLRIGIMAPEVAEHRQTIHLRHREIEQDDLHIRLAQPADRLPAVRCLEDLILPLEKLPQDDAIDLRIICNEHRLLPVHKIAFLTQRIPTLFY